MFDATIKKQTTVKKVVKKIVKKQATVSIYNKTQIGKLVILTPKEDFETALSEMNQTTQQQTKATVSEFQLLPKYLSASSEEVALLWKKTTPEVNKTHVAAAFTYADLLSDLRNILNQNTKAQSEIPPETVKVGTLRTRIANFAAVCDSLNRSKDVIAKYISVQFDCDCAVNEADGSLLIKKRLPNDQIVGMVRKYKNEFVQCVSCGSLNTIISKNEGGKDQVLSCEECQAQRHVK